MLGISRDTISAARAAARAPSLALVLLTISSSFATDDELSCSMAPVLPPDAKVVPATSTPEAAHVEPSSVPSESEKFRIRPDKVYYNPGEISSPAVLSASKVYARIPAYRQVLDRRITTDDPEYWPLMRQASRVFLRGIKAVCAKHGYDLVGEIGAVTPKNPAEVVPDITRHVIAAVCAGPKPVGVAEDDASHVDGVDELDELVNFPVLDH